MRPDRHGSRRASRRVPTDTQDGRRSARKHRAATRMTDQLPAIVQPGVLIAPTDTYMVPAPRAAAGDAAGCRYVEFFTANIRNPHTRRAYARACGRFFAWCEGRGLTLTTIRPPTSPPI